MATLATPLVGTKVTNGNEHFHCEVFGIVVVLLFLFFDVFHISSIFNHLDDAGFCDFSCVFSDRWCAR